MYIIQLLISHFFATLCVVIPAFNLLPYKMHRKFKSIMFISVFLVLCLSYMCHIENYTNILIVPILMIFIAYFSKSKMIPNTIFGILSYIMTVLVNNTMIITLLKFNINIINFDMYGQFIFLAVYNAIIIVITYCLGIIIRNRTGLFDRFAVLYNTFIKKLIITVPIFISFIAYNILVHLEKINNYDMDIIINNVTRSTIIFLVVLIFYTIIIIKFYSINNKYNKKVKDIAESIDKLKSLDESELDIISKKINSNEMDSANDIAKEIIKNITHK